MEHTSSKIILPIWHTHSATRQLFGLALLGAILVLGPRAPALGQDNQAGASTDLTAPTGPAPAPVVEVPTTQPAQQVEPQRAQPRAVPQAPLPQQPWGYAYPPPNAAYPAAGVPGVHYGYQQPAPQPQYHFEMQERATKGLYVPGIILFGIGWIGNFAIATPLANLASNDRPAAAEEDAWAWSVVPVIGPIAQLAVGAPHPAIPITMGLMQIGGLALFIAGLIQKETVQVRVIGPPDGNGTTVDLDAVPVEGGGVLQMTVGHL